MKTASRVILALLIAGVCLGCSSTNRSRGPAYTLTVEAGPYERQESVVRFALPEGFSGGAARIIDDDGRRVPVQVGPGGEAWFVLDRLGAGLTKTYRLEARAAAPDEPVDLRRQAGALTFAVKGAPVLRYHAEKTPLPRPDIEPIYQRGGYIHPVHTPSGRVVTDDYPSNHVHHHGIWTAWTNTVFEGRKPDFWNMGQGTGTVEPVGLDTAWSGPVHGGFRARHQYVDLTAPEPKVALNEGWEVRVYDVQGGERPIRMFDLTVTQETATSSPLVLPEYHYGSVGFRGPMAWNGEANTFFLTSEGKDRSNGHATRARWCHIGGYVDGELAGVAILGHPENVRAPQPMRIHPSEPFFSWAPTLLGDWAIEPGRVHTARFRYIVYDGPPDAVLLDRLWNDYAHPVAVHVAKEGA